MIKYVPEDTSVVFSEIPDEVTLAINISNCTNRCKGCHTPYLQTDTGKELSYSDIDELISANAGITCVCLMGEGNDKETFFKVAQYIATNYKNVKLAVYSGRENVEKWYSEVFDYVKLGRYDEHYGAINEKDTNQRLYMKTKYGDNTQTILGKGWSDITSKMQK